MPILLLLAASCLTRGRSDQVIVSSANFGARSVAIAMVWWVRGEAAAARPARAVHI
jgi:hypothetical protein